MSIHGEGGATAAVSERMAFLGTLEFIVLGVILIANAWISLPTVSLRQ